jgi:hypothetical protein
MRLCTGVCGCRQEGEWPDVQWLQKLFSTAHEPNCHVHFSLLHETDCTHFTFSIFENQRSSSAWHETTWLKPLSSVCMPPDVCQYVCFVVLGLPVCYLFLWLYCLYCILHLISFKFPVLKHSSSIVCMCIYIYIYIYTLPMLKYHCPSLQPLFIYVYYIEGSLCASHYVTDVESLQAGGGVMLLSLMYCPCGSDMVCA